MDLHRIIPVLLLRDTAVVKTKQFGNARYVGDIINAVNIFNEKLVDEIVVLDIDATVSGRGPNFEIIRNLASECFMPLCYGGGVTSPKQAERIFTSGVEKIAINSAFHENPAIISECAQHFGSQSVVCSIDARLDGNGAYGVYTRSGRSRTQEAPWDCARRAVECGAGEIIIQSIDRDGTRTGYDLDLIRRVAASVDAPVVAAGGAGSLDDLVAAIVEGNAAAAAAGSLFVFYGKLQAVLITVPEHDERHRRISEARKLNFSGASLKPG